MELRFCVRCVMDGSAQELFLDKDGICNFCHQAQKDLAESEKERPLLPFIIDQIKVDGLGKDYDCLIGLSGGIDSSTVLVRAVSLGLRPLCYSIDNGWNDPKADENIMNLVEGLQVPFFRYTINTDLFKKLQAALIEAGIKNLEVATDHILFASTYEMANKYGIRWVLTGGNVATESIMPASWGEDPRDLYWIKSIYKRFTGKRLKGLPIIPLWKEQYYRLIKRIKFVRLLDYQEYNREEAIKYLQDNFGWKSYGDKHQESIWTWWFQSFYLFSKFGIDKRKAHYSSLINSGQMTRTEAKELLGYRPVYPELGVEKRIMRYPKKTYHDYPNSEWIRKIVIKLYAARKRLSNLSS
jgi:N-acetyl sugar amidotransferase